MALFNNSLKNLLPQIADRFPDGIALFDPISTVPLYLNDNFAALLGMAKDALLSGNVRFPFSLPAKGSQRISYQTPVRSITLDCRVFPLKLDEQKITALTIRDVTDTVHKENLLAEKEERLRLAFQGSRDGIWDWDIRTGKMHFSKEWKLMVGCTEQEISDHPDAWFKRVHDSDIPALQSAIQDHLRGKTPQFKSQYRILHKDFTYRWMICSGAAINGTDGRPARLTGVQVDITIQKDGESRLKEALEDLQLALTSERLLLQELDRKNKELTELSITDGLTKLFNHRFLQERFDYEFGRAKRYGQTLSCLLIDIDFFKKINDSYGHQFGDCVLRDLSRLLKENSRETDICGRYGGEEFMIVTAQPLEDAIKFAHKLHSAIGNYPFSDGKTTIKVTISVGISDYRSEIKTKQEMIERADNALYQAKHDGRNTIRQWKEKNNEEDKTIDPKAIQNLKDRFNELTEEVRTTYIESTNALVNAIDAKDHYTREHSQNVANYATELSKALNLPDKMVESIRNAALLHDVGKIGIAQEILLKNGSLTNEEFEVMKRHPVIGINILKDVKFLEKEQPIILHHHERFDGKGYPHGLKGFEIPLGARILAVVDAYDAMTTDRPYRKALTKEVAIEELKKGIGKQFSEELVGVFINTLE
jgi:diguanylate cyclase (GGDEF)-like protein/PAS domain S-box-containing protein/putative nucleotidyltransferase with HDIG domain